MNLIVLIPSYDRAQKLAKTLSGIEANVNIPASDIVVFDQPKGSPAGLGKARNTVCRMGYEKHGQEALYLMLDDDADLFDPTLSNVRWAMDHFLSDPYLGVCQLTNSRLPSRDKITSRSSWIMHSFLIRGRVFAGPNPVNYVDEDNSFDEVVFSARAYLAGWSLCRSDRARIPRDTIVRGAKVRGRTPELRFSPKAAGGNEGSVKDGIEYTSAVWKYLVDPGYFTVGEWYFRGEHKIPNCSTIKATPKAHATHKENRLGLRFL